MFKNPNLQTYYNNGFFRVAGYCTTDLFHVIDLLDSSGINNKGGIAEIGVHHGQFYMMLNATTNTSDRSYAIDVFENQELNIDNSGNGSRSLFEANLRNVDIHHGGNTIIIQGDSTDPALNLVQTIGPGTCRYVSIDGGHTVEHTLNDLKIAERLISNEGVVILDDIMHYCWVGVIQAAVKYLSTNPTLVPFAIGHNKLFMCKIAYYKKYFDLLSNSTLSKNWPQRFVGHQIVTL